nr:MAG TPA: hypothetical protein [Caudoviricetes sp.]
MIITCDINVYSVTTYWLLTKSSNYCVNLNPSCK